MPKKVIPVGLAMPDKMLKFSAFFCFLPNMCYTVPSLSDVSAVAQNYVPFRSLLVFSLYDGIYRSGLGRRE